jgi:hypothetical protein
MFLIMAGLSAAVPAWAQASNDAFVLDPTVQNLVAAQVKGYKPPASRVEITARDENVRGSSNFRATAKERYVAQENGLWGVGLEIIQGPFNSTGSGARLSLCGHTTLLNVASTSNTSTNLGIIPLGGLFIPFGIRQTNNPTTRAQVTAFTTDAQSICSPIPGSRFRVGVERETLVVLPSGQRHELRESVRETCEVAAEPRSATELGAGSRGQALLVTCERALKNGRTDTARYAYLTEAGLYLPLRIPSDDTIRTIHYDSVEYGN